MIRVRRSAWRSLQAALLLVLLLTPLAVRGHGHADHSTARPCAVCLATTQSPIVSTPVAALPVPVLRAVLAVLPQPRPAGRLERPTLGGRAPPVALLAVV